MIQTLYLVFLKAGYGTFNNSTRNQYFYFITMLKRKIRFNFFSNKAGILNTHNTTFLPYYLSFLIFVLKWKIFYLQDIISLSIRLT